MIGLPTQSHRTAAATPCLCLSNLIAESATAPQATGDVELLSLIVVVLALGAVLAAAIWYLRARRSRSNDASREAGECAPPVEVVDISPPNQRTNPGEKHARSRNRRFVL